jgi:uncharacterized protein YcfJ
MKKIGLTLLAAFGSAWCGAQEFGRVLSSTPVIQQVQVPRQVCSPAVWQAPAQKSGAGTVLGALAGGVIGNSIGQGSGRAAATAIGIFGGAMLGDRLEGSGDGNTPYTQNCATHTVVENRVVGYNVVYEYAGRQYAVQMPQDPGPQVQLQITPVGSLPPPPAPPVVYATPPAPALVVTQPVYITSTTTWYPVHPAYVHRPQIGIDLHLDNRGRHHPRHWR